MSKSTFEHHGRALELVKYGPSGPWRVQIPGTRNKFPQGYEFRKLAEASFKQTYAHPEVFNRAFYVHNQFSW